MKIYFSSNTFFKSLLIINIFFFQEVNPEIINIETNESKPSNKIIDSGISNNIPNLINVLSEDEIKKNDNKGKSDIFSFGDFENPDISKSITLLGVYSTPSESYAIVKYKNSSGNISKGDIGGLNTLLIPKDFQVVEIDLDGFSLTLKFKNKEYKITG